MTSAAPSVTVLMPVYNAANHLDEAVQSVLDQSYSDFELLCVDDGSTDASPEILARYAEKDSRVRVFRNKENKGIAFSLNRGLREARAELVARMDSDDVCLPDRLALQAAFMVASPDVLVCSGAMVLHETGIHFPLPPNDMTIRIHMLWAPPFSHPAVMFRRGPILEVGGYDTSMVPAEDYDLWTRLADIRGWRFANLGALLLRYRMYPGRDRGAYMARQQEKAFSISLRLLCQLGLAEPGLDKAAHAVFAGFNPETFVSKKRLEAWVEALIYRNRKIKLFPPELFERVCHERMLSIAVKAEWIPLWIKRMIPAEITLIVKRFLFASRH